MSMTEQVGTNDVHAQAARVISSAVKWSAAAAIVPIPVVDLIALGAVQVKMVRDLAHVYGTDADSETLQSVVSALLGTLASAAISGGLLGSSLKVVPVGGTILGGVGLRLLGLLRPMRLARFLSLILRRGAQCRPSVLRLLRRSSSRSS